MCCTQDRELWTHQPHDQEPHRADEPEERQTRHAPQHDGHVDGGALVVGLLGALVADALQPRRAQHDGAEREVAKYPDQHDRAAEPLVVVLLLLLLGDLLLLLGRL